jgi:ABC-type uncharacterized transport system substrate-binding protein
MRRRDFNLVVLGAAMLWSLPGYAQRPSTRTPRIGVLLPGTPTSFALRTRAFLDGLSELGRAEGQSVAIEWRWAEDRPDRLPELSAELVRSNVDVIVTGGTPAAQALRAATRSIPIVVAIMADPVAAGLVESLAHPGGNLTGFSIVAPQLGAKRLQLLKEIVPDMHLVGVLLNAKNPQSQIELKEMEAAASSMGLQLHPIEISSAGRLREAFAALSKVAPQALIVLTDPLLFSERKPTVDLASMNRLPAMYPFQGYVEEGGLISYGPSDADLFKRAAGYVDKILRGTKPSELPVEQPTRFEMHINLKAARALGLTIPETFLARADKVLE